MRKVLLALGMVASVLVTTSPARAGGPDHDYYSIEYPDAMHNANLWVARTARIVRGGFGATWDLKFVCPRRARYTIDAYVGNLNPVSVPPLRDGDGQIWASLKEPVTGTCSGTVQKVKVHLYTHKAQWPDTYFDGVFYPAGSCWCPLIPDNHAESQAEVSGDGFEAMYAVNVGANRTASNYIALVGPWHDPKAPKKRP